MENNIKWPIVFVRLLSLVGLLDALYLTVKHFQGELPTCAIAGCDVVLTSSFATVGPIPIALFGVLFYLTVLVLSFFVKHPKILLMLLVLTSLGVVTSLYLVYLQFYVIRSICQYCMISAVVSKVNFLLVLYLFSNRPKYTPVL